MHKKENCFLCIKAFLALLATMDFGKMVCIRRETFSNLRMLAAVCDGNLYVFAGGPFANLFLHAAASGGSLSDSPERDERATKGERGFDSPLPFGIPSP